MNLCKNLFIQNKNIHNKLLKCNFYIGNNLNCQAKTLQTQNLKKKRICIVGAGPAGFYAAQYLLKHLNDCAVDVIEKLPVPFGLVRFGVAPDHPEVKNVINTFTKTAENAHFRFLGNLTLGKDVTLKELRDCYHAVLLTYGADKDRHLEIPNENEANVISARKFVAWYNGLPGAENLKLNLNGENVVIVGQGNVAVDVARMLLTPVDVLKETDTTEYALETLARSKIKRVFLVGRRGPLQAAFTIKELREMLKLPNVQTIWRSKDFEGVAEQVPNLARPRKRLTELMLKSLSEQHSNKITKTKEAVREFLPIFFRAPKKIYEKEKEMEFTITQLIYNQAKLTTQTERFPADLVLRSIGYKSICVDDGICFDEQNGYIFNENGRIYKDAANKIIDNGLYVGGWLATGPTGVILTTMNGAFSVAKTICDDIANKIINTDVSKSGLDVQNKRVVAWEGWKRINEAEIEAGKTKGKPREKIVEIEKMLQIATGN